MIPDAFMKLCSYLHQDVGLDGIGPEEWVAIGIKNLRRTEVMIVQRFLDELLDERVSDSELQDVWLRSGADILFPESGDLRQFLALVRKSLA